ncbi:MAG: hypothetical protein AB7P52_10855 [Alphaproteobacteria bacterium]
MSRKQNPLEPVEKGTGGRAAKPLTEPFDAVQPPISDELPVFEEPPPTVEPGDPSARSLVDEMSRREVEELNRALDEANGVADSVVMTLRLSPREYERLNEFAREHGMTQQVLMRDALFEFIDRRTE